MKTGDLVLWEGFYETEWGLIIKDYIGEYPMKRRHRLEKTKKTARLKLDAKRHPAHVHSKVLVLWNDGSVSAIAQSVIEVVSEREA